VALASGNIGEKNDRGKHLSQPPGKGSEGQLLTCATNVLTGKKEEKTLNRRGFDLGRTTIKIGRTDVEEVICG